MLGEPVHSSSMDQGLLHRNDRDIGDLLEGTLTDHFKWVFPCLFLKSDNRSLLLSIVEHLMDWHTVVDRPVRPWLNLREFEGEFLHVAGGIHDVSVGVLHPKLAVSQLDALTLPPAEGLDIL